jgi:hypothetical protein
MARRSKQFSSTIQKTNGSSGGAWNNSPMRATAGRARSCWPRTATSTCTGPSSFCAGAARSKPQFASCSEAFACDADHQDVRALPARRSALTGRAAWISSADAEQRRAAAIDSGRA